MATPNQPGDIDDYELRVVAYMDILGFKDWIDTSVGETETRMKVRDVLKHFKLIVDIEKERIADGHETSFRTTTFSDHIVFSQLETKKYAIFNVLRAVIKNQQFLAEHGMVARGAIVVGKLYHDEDTVFGPALNEAYRLESNEAKYPRVIIEQSVLDPWGHFQTAQVDYDDDLDTVNHQVANYITINDSQDGRSSTAFYTFCNIERDQIKSIVEIQPLICKTAAILRDRSRDEKILDKYKWLRDDYNKTLRGLTSPSVNKYLLD